MTQEQRDAWCKALRSGKYRQGDSRLRNADGSYCCLGVLCDVIDSDRWIRRELRGDIMFLWGDHSLKLPSAMLPERVQGALMGMNDLDKQPFEHIADWIEQHVEVTA